MALTQLHLNDPTPRFHLIEPYEWAIATQAMREGLGTLEGTAERRAPATDDHIRTAMQLLVLDEQPSITYSASGDSFDDPAVRDRLNHLNLRGLQEFGLVAFKDHPQEYVIEGVDAIRKHWQELERFITDYEEFIIGQLSVSGVEIHWSILRLLTAIRTENRLRITLLESSIPAAEVRTARILMQHAWNPEIILSFDSIVWGVCRNIRTALDIAVAEDRQIIGGEPALRHQSDKTTFQLWKVIADRLLKEEIVFPTPESFKDVVRLRALPEIHAFRQFFFPFFRAALLGDGDAIVHLGRELDQVIRCLKLLPVAKGGIKFFTYAAIASEIVQTLKGSIGPSIPLAFVPLGLERIAEKWRAKTSWVNVGGRS